MEVSLFKEVANLSVLDNRIVRLKSWARDLAITLTERAKLQEQRLVRHC